MKDLNMSLPHEIDKQAELAKHIQKLAVFEISKKNMAEDTKDIKADIKKLAGKDFDIASHVKAVVNTYKLKQEAEEGVSKAENAIAGVAILTKYFKGNIHDEAEKYI